MRWPLVGQQKAKDDAPVLPLAPDLAIDADRGLRPMMIAVVRLALFEEPPWRDADGQLLFFS